MPTPAADATLFASYGGGVDTVAMLIALRTLNRIPTAICMADPGSEWPETHRYRVAVMDPWLKANGFPTVTLINRKEEGVHRPGAWRLETLEEECLRIGALPSVAYGFKKCSLKYKAEPQRWWLARQPWARAAWGNGRKIVKCIGYDYDEQHRVKDAFQNEWEDARLVPWYPLFELKLTRMDALQVIARAGLPPPPKSSCTYCPNSTLEEWVRLRDTEPEAFTRAVAMSRNAQVTTPDVVGLMRCNPHGQRQLHVWADGGYDTGAAAGRPRELSDEMPCECAD